MDRMIPIVAMGVVLLIGGSWARADYDGDGARWAAYRYQQAEADLQSAQAAMDANVAALQSALAQIDALSRQLPQNQQDAEALRRQIDAVREDAGRIARDLDAAGQSEAAARQTLAQQRERTADAQAAVTAAQTAALRDFENSADMQAAQTAVAQAQQRVRAAVDAATGRFAATDQYQRHMGAIVEAQARVTANGNDPSMYQTRLRRAQQDLALAEAALARAQDAFIGADAEVAAAERNAQSAQGAAERLRRDFQRGLATHPDVAPAMAALAREQTAERRLIQAHDSAAQRLAAARTARDEQTAWLNNAQTQAQQLDIQIQEQDRQLRDLQASIYSWQMQASSAQSAYEQARLARDLAYADYAQAQSYASDFGWTAYEGVWFGSSWDHRRSDWNRNRGDWHYDRRNYDRPHGQRPNYDRPDRDHRNDAPTPPRHVAPPPQRRPVPQRQVEAPTQRRNIPGTERQQWQRERLERQRENNAPPAGPRRPAR